MPEDGGGLNLKVEKCVEGKESQLFTVPQGEVGAIRLAKHNNTCVTVTGPGWQKWPEDWKSDANLLWLWRCGENFWNGQLWNFPQENTGQIFWAQNHSKCLDANRLYAR